jgi:5-methylcytosine-specific restriction endonuclease McrA
LISSIDRLHVIIYNLQQKVDELSGRKPTACRQRSSRTVSESKKNFPHIMRAKAFGGKWEVLPITEIRLAAKECHWCKCPLTFEQTTIDHVVPMNLGGDHLRENVVVACLSCNSRRGSSAKKKKGNNDAEHHEENNTVPPMRPSVHVDDIEQKREDSPVL